MANRSMAPGIILSYAISADPGGGYSCDGWGSLLAASDCCRLLCSASPGFRAKFLAHTHSGRFAWLLTLAISGRFAHAGLCSNP